MKFTIQCFLAFDLWEENVENNTQDTINKMYPEYKGIEDYLILVKYNQQIVKIRAATHKTKTTISDVEWWDESLISLPNVYRNFNESNTEFSVKSFIKSDGQQLHHVYLNNNLCGWFVFSSNTNTCMASRKALNAKQHL